jgi:flagellar protein FliS
MTTAALARNRYLRDSVVTASPARLVVMLYDALVRDLTVAVEALQQQDRVTAHERLVKAQAIVTELHDSLDVSVWDGAAGLAALYSFVLEQLVAANVAKDPAPVTAALDVVVPLRDAWAEAAAATGS